MWRNNSYVCEKHNGEIKYSKNIEVDVPIYMGRRFIESSHKKKSNCCEVMI